MKFKLTKCWCTDIELMYGEKLVMLTDKNNSIILTEEEYYSIPEFKQYLISYGMVVVEMIEEEIIVEKSKNHKQK